MNLKNMIKQTWATGILLFGFLVYRNKTANSPKTTNEMTTEDNK